MAYDFSLGTNTGDLDKQTALGKSRVGGVLGFEEKALQTVDVPGKSLS